MSVCIKTTNQLSQGEIAQVSGLAARGFGRNDDAAMAADTAEHLSAAQFTVLETHHGEVRGFSMIRSCLWR